MRMALLNIAALCGAVVGFLLIDAYGRTLTAPAPQTIASPHGLRPEANPLIPVLTTLSAVVALGWALAKVFRFLGQPPVIGEIVAGIMLGPSFLGLLWPEAADFLLPQRAGEFLKVIAQIGVILYMFLVGLELNPGLLRERTQATITISLASIAVPFVLGGALALLLYGRLSTANVPFTSFALFLGVATSITAFPVLARILTDLRIQKTELGVMALACAAMNDVTAWCLLALVVGVAQARLGDAVRVIGLTLAYIAFMFVVVRPCATRFLNNLVTTRLTRGAVAITFVALLLSSLATELIGVHAIFGAFLLGAVIPHDSAVAREFIEKLEDLVTVLLLPAFFAFVGLRTEIALVSGLDQALLCLLIIAVATAGKVGGTLLAACATGLGWREASSLGILMNTRGLMELIVLNVGLELGIISPTLFVMMVLMALATTMATTPILKLMRREQTGSSTG